MTQTEAEWLDTEIDKALTVVQREICRARLAGLRLLILQLRSCAESDAVSDAARCIARYESARQLDRPYTG